MKKRPFLLILLAFSGAAHAQETLVFDAPQTAGISGFRALWNTPVVLSADGATEIVKKHTFGEAPSALWSPEKRAGRNGALVFDAVHRSLLVRFPGAAKPIAEKLRAGQGLQKVDLILPFKGTELWPEGYAEPAGMSFLGDQWAKSKPRWHAVAWALRKPWQADAVSGPTFNANINGASFWNRYGAQDEAADRFPNRFGRAEISSEKTEPLDVTALLNNAAFGKTIEERLRKLEYCGFLVRKEELYDLSQFRGGYEWNTMRGQQGILIDTPRLVVTFAPGPKARVDDKKLTFDWAKVRGGVPTATVPSEAEFEKLKTRLSFARPAWMIADWQWQRVQELAALQEKTGKRSPDFPPSYDAYLKWLDEQLARAPRSWRGFDAAEVTQLFFKYGAALPEPVKDHWKLYWQSWLMPDRAYDGFEYNGKTYRFAQGYVGGKEMEAYQAATGDWRGNASVYRTYARDMGTMNFNHWATAGVLLGGRIIGSEAMMQEGQRGLEKFPLRTWSWFDGSTQESIDHYYFAESLTGQKLFADFGPSPATRLMGQSMLAKSMEELAGAYHPNLRRMISSSGRTGIAYVLGIQDGLQHALHTLSPSGALTDVEAKEITASNVEKMPVFGQNFTPGMAANQTLNGAWAPDWFAHIVDEKPLPYEFTNSYKQWGNYSATPLYKRGYLGQHYGMASLDVVSNETVPFMVQWRRDAKKVDSMTQLGTLLVRGGVNRTELLDSILHGTTTRNPNGTVGHQGMQNVTLQDKNRALVLCSPYANLGDMGGRARPNELTSLQSTIGLFHFAPAVPWELWVDGQKITQLPHRAKYGSKITLRDGVSYLALIPLASAMPRDVDIEIVDNGQMTPLQGGGQAREALRINAYIYKGAPLDVSAPQMNLAFGGYVIEAGDEAEYGSFANFQKRINEAKLTTNWDAAQKAVEVIYRSGPDTLRGVYKTDYAGGAPTTNGWAVREVNGKWPYLAPGFERDTSISQQGTSGKLEKNGATFIFEPGRMAYLLTEPKSGTFMGLNPFSEAMNWSLNLPGGMEIKTGGKLGMARLIARPAENKIWIDGDTAGEAKALHIFGAKAAPQVLLNGAPVKVAPQTLEGKAAFVVALRR